MRWVVFVRISNNTTSEARVSHDQGHIYILLWIHLTYIDIPIHIGHTINQLIPPLYWFSFTHKSSPLHVLLSSNLDTLKYPVQSNTQRQVVCNTKICKAGVRLIALLHIICHKGKSLDK